MKVFRFSTILILISLLVITGCKKDEDIADIIADAIADDDLANVVAGSLGDSQSAYAFTSQAELAAKRFQVTPTPAEPAKTLFDSTFTVSKTSTYYTFSYTMWLTANWANFGNVLNFDMKGKGIFETQRVITNDSSSSALIVKSVLANVSDYYISGNYKRIGETTLKRNAALKISSTTTMLFDSVLVDKDSLYLRKGKADLLINYTAAGKTNTVSAQVVYLSNKSATLVLNGKTYSIDLTKAEATKK